MHPLSEEEQKQLELLFEEVKSSAQRLAGDKRIEYLLAVGPHMAYAGTAGYRMLMIESLLVDAVKYMVDDDSNGLRTQLGLVTAIIHAINSSHQLLEEHQRHYGINTPLSPEKERMVKDLLENLTRSEEGNQ